MRHVEALQAFPTLQTQGSQGHIEKVHWNAGATGLSTSEILTEIMHLLNVPAVRGSNGPRTSSARSSSSTF